MTKIKTSDFRIQTPVQLKDLDTSKDFGRSKKDLEKKLVKTRKKLGVLQNTLYAHGKYAVLICIQGMDTAGKDSLIREVFKDFNSSGVVVHSFKAPSTLERKHDYLWRHYKALPARGRFAVFNRTHYENVLVTRVHPEFLLGNFLHDVQSVDDVTPEFWDRRFEQINNFEKTISENGTIIFKFFLNLSKEEQKARLIRRLRKKEKNWKFSPGDLEERKFWDHYMDCYQDVLNRTSTPHAPWFAVPADNKDAARLIVARILYTELKKYKDIREPELEPEVASKISEFIERLENE